MTDLGARMCQFSDVVEKIGRALYATKDNGRDHLLLHGA